MSHSYVTLEGEFKEYSLPSAPRLPPPPEIPPPPPPHSDTSNMNKIHVKYLKPLPPSNGPVQRQDQNYTHHQQDELQLKHSSITSSISESDIKYYYVKLINYEFRHLQLDTKMHSKSLFDLIDYCELLYEQSSPLLSSTNSNDHLQGLKLYTKGYLIFNYFINSFIIMHFKGFDSFIETNEQDFIIYLNIFAFYNTHDYFQNGIYSISSDQLRNYVKEYLVDKKLLSFNIEDLYNWLNEYINYLKEKDQEDINISNLSIQDGASLPNDRRSVSSVLSSEGESIDDFEMRYPSLKSPTRKDPPPASPPPVPREIPEILLEKSYSQSADAITSSRKYTKPPPPAPPAAPPPPRPPVTQDNNNKYLGRPMFGNQGLSKSQNNLPYPKVDQIPYPASEGTFETSNNPFYTRSRAETPDGQFRHLQTMSQLPNPNQFQNGNISNGSTLPPPVRYLNSHTPQPQQYQNNQLYQNNFQPFTYATSPPHSELHTPHAYTQPQVSEYHYNANLIMSPQQQHQQYMISQHEQLKMQRVNMLKENAVCGMRNFGSSCYINSTIQLLFGIYSFKKIFTNGFQKYIKDEKYLRILAHPDSHKKDCVLLAEAISGLLRTFQQNGSLSISPTKFIRVNSLIKPDFNIPHEQQDAQEYLLFLLERLHDELADKQPHSQYDVEDYIRKWKININVKDKGEYLKWCNSLLQHEGTSPVHDLFQGHLQNKLACTKCGYESISYSPFSILSLPIPSSRNAHNVVNLADCLRYYTQDEVLSGENAWHCPKCHGESDPQEGHLLDDHPVFTTKRSGIFRLGKKSKSSGNSKKSKSSNGSSNNQKQLSTTISTKSLNFIKLPQILLIHLARFSMYNLTDKLDTMIKYPLNLKFNNNGHEIVYKLSGIINHFGNLKSGHYTALVNKSLVNLPKGSGNGMENLMHPFWCLFDDENVKSNVANGSLHPPYDELTSQDVYVLCYERV